MVYPCKGSASLRVGMGTGARRIISRGGQIKGLGTKVSPQGPEMEPQWESAAKPS